MNRRDLALVTALAIPFRVAFITKRPLLYWENDTLIFTDNISYLLTHPWGDSHSPFFYLLVSLSRQIFGTTHFGLRAPAILAGVLMAPAMYLLARELHSRRAGLYAGALVAVAPFAVQWSRYSRMYSLVGLFVILSNLAFVRLLNRGITPRRSAVYALATAGAFYAHVFGLFAWVTHVGLLILWRTLPHPTPAMDRLSEWARPIGGAFLLTLPWFAALAYRMLLGMPSGPGPAFSLHRMFVNAGTWWGYGFFVRDAVAPFPTLRAVAAAVVGITLLGACVRVVLGESWRPALHHRTPWILIAWVAVPLAGLSFLSAIMSRDFAAPRWFMPSAVGFYALVGVGLAKIERHQLQKAAAGIAIAGLVFTGGFYAYSTHEPIEFQEAVGYVDENAEAGTVVVTGNTKPRPLFSFYSNRTDLEHRGISRADQIGQVVTDEESVWVLGTRPRTYEAIHRLKKSPGYEVVDTKKFRGVVVYRFVST